MRFQDDEVLLRAASGRLACAFGLTCATLEFAKIGIRVNRVSLGTIRPDMFNRACGPAGVNMEETIATPNSLGPLARLRKLPARSSGSILPARLHHGQDYHHRRWLHYAITSRIKKPQAIIRNMRGSTLLRVSRALMRNRPHVPSVV